MSKKRERGIESSECHEVVNEAVEPVPRSPQQNTKIYERVWIIPNHLCNRAARALSVRY